MSDVAAWHFAEQALFPCFTGWNCETGDWLYGGKAKEKLAEVGGVVVSEIDTDRRRWWAHANPELAKGKRWWGLPTPADAPMAGDVGPLRGGWKDYAQVTTTEKPNEPAA